MSAAVSTPETTAAPVAPAVLRVEGVTKTFHRGVWAAALAVGVSWVLRRAVGTRA